MTRPLRWVRTLTIGMAAAVAACSAAPTTDVTAVYPLDDRELVPGFDDATLLDDATFGDLEWTEQNAQQYLERTHYATRSFLADYRSGDCGEPGTWCSAAHAVLVAGRLYAINPRLLLAFAEVQGQLLSAIEYPQPSARVEFAFACGCTLSGCSGESAGFGKQVNCLARNLRSAFDAASAGAKTARGLGTGLRFMTGDGIPVTPTNPATTAIYDIVPEVSEGSGGAWMVAAVLTKIH